MTNSIPATPTTPRSSSNDMHLLPLAPKSTQRCKYRTGKCPHIRAVKANGAQHALCQYHREKANKNQQAFDNKRRRSITTSNTTEATSEIETEKEAAAVKKRRRSKVKKSQTTPTLVKLDPLRKFPGEEATSAAAAAIEGRREDGGGHTTIPLYFKSQEFGEDVFDFATSEIDFLQRVLNTSPETIYGEFQLHNVMYPFAEQAGVRPREEALDSPVTRPNQMNLRTFESALSISPALKVPLELGSSLNDRFKPNPEGPVPLQLDGKQHPHSMPSYPTFYERAGFDKAGDTKSMPASVPGPPSLFPPRRGFALNFDVI